ncbi:MAG: serine/threonine phosphatase [Coleofasciculus sp. Co-bin14]|nr:serine/threonine phosphatase [Coleofasciculus sp. Co-bin14]
MLICPQCQFENPNTNKFCQRCGTSLTHKSCDECSTQVPVNAATCHNCGAFTGTVWWAIISKDTESLNSPTSSQSVPDEELEPIPSSAAQAEVEQQPMPTAVDNGEPSQLETPPKTTEVVASGSSPPRVEEDNLNVVAASASTPEPIEEILDEAVTQPLYRAIQSNFPESSTEDSSKSEMSPTAGGNYLDHQQRYRLLEPQSLENLPSDVNSPYEISVRVLDCQPFQKSLLEALMEQQEGDDQGYDLSLNQSSTTDLDSWKILGIPAIAQPYLALKKLFYPNPTLPKVHDAWQQNGEAVVLLEDRSDWLLLAHLWGNEQLSSLQILYWLDEMAKLWEALEPWHCRQSLLETTNLRVDEDQALCLVRLYPDPEDQQLTLQDLGQTWQMLFSQSQRTQFTALGSLFREMCIDEIRTIQDLRSQLKAIAHEHQTSFTMSSQSQDSAETAVTADGQAVSLEDTGSAVLTKSPSNEMSNANESDDLPTVILPMQLLSLDDAGCTDNGHQREHNEDYFSILTQIKKQENPMGRVVQARGLYILCDGMGGHAAGEVASAMAVETIKRYFQEHWNEQFPTDDSVREAVRLANQAIFDVNQKNARSGSGRMGTTLAMILIENTKAVIAHVGDSRVYRLTRKRGLEQITVDHEVGQRELNRGVPREIAYIRADALLLTQALGARIYQFINPDVQFLELNEDTLFVLCSDGLSDNDLIENHWQTHLAPLLSSRASLDQGILQLIELANELNGHDNITTVLIRVKVRPNFEQQQLL